MARPLTAREKQIAKLVECGFSVSTIGNRLGVSKYTVFRQIDSIADKLGIGMVDGQWGKKRLQLAIALNISDLTEEIEDLRKRLSKYEAA